MAAVRSSTKVVKMLENIDVVQELVQENRHVTYRDVEAGAARQGGKRGVASP